MPSLAEECCSNFFLNALRHSPYSSESYTINEESLLSAQPLLCIVHFRLIVFRRRPATPKRPAGSAATPQRCSMSSSSPLQTFEYQYLFGTGIPNLSTFKTSSAIKANSSSPMLVRVGESTWQSIFLRARAISSGDEPMMLTNPKFSRLFIPGVRGLPRWASQRDLSLCSP